jgi:hypothetical protein
VKAANIKVESYWPALFAKLLEKRNVEDLILSVGSGIHPFSLSMYFCMLTSIVWNLWVVAWWQLW